MLKIVEFHYIFVDVGMSRGPTSEVEKIETFQISQKLVKLHEMTGNGQKSVWEYHLGAETIHFGDLGCPGRYSGVLEGGFHVDCQNPKVWYGGENITKTNQNLSKVMNFHVRIGNGQQSVPVRHVFSFLRIA